MRSIPLPRRLGLLISVLAALGWAGCGGSGREGAAVDVVEKHVAATEAFGVMLADIQTSADLTQMKPDLLRQARAMTDSAAALNAEVLDNPRISDAEKTAAIEPFQMRLAAAERLWREEAQRITRTFGNNALADVNAVVANAR
jgi:hypothetical protein